jgi:DNA-binding response OmpR family regulator
MGRKLSFGQEGYWMEKSHILIVDDDPDLQKVVQKYLREDGYIVYPALTGQESLDILKGKRVDLILLDMLLPDTDGLALMTQYRNSSKVPIIVVSGKSDAADRVVGLEMGADDYLTKPFHMRELSARIKSVLRRSVDVIPANENKDRTGSKKLSGMIYFGDWKMDCDKYEVSSTGGEPAPLTSGEFKLLRALVETPGRVLSREQLFEITRGADYDTYDRAVDIQIGRLRKKLGDDPNQPALIKTVRGVGYIFIGDVRAQA